MDHDGFAHQVPDVDPVETAEWLESLDAVVAQRGVERARYVLLRLLARARDHGVGVAEIGRAHV